MGAAVTGVGERTSCSYFPHREQRIGAASHHEFSVGAGRDLVVAKQRSKHGGSAQRGVAGELDGGRDSFRYLNSVIAW